MNIPSHLVKVGDEISIKETKTKKKIFEKITETLEKANLPSWIAVDSKKKSAKITNQPSEADFDRVFDVKLIIEYYSQR